MMTAGHVLAGAALAAAVADWWAVARDDKRLEHVLKPLVMALLFAAALALGGDDTVRRLAFTLGAIALSAAGDVFLMLRRERFLAGVGSFLLAHVAYVIAFGTLRADGASAAALAMVLLIGAAFYERLRRGMVARGQAKLALPVAVYVLAIGAMVASGLVTLVRPDWEAWRAAPAATGALLFMVSDSVIGWTRFVRGFRGDRVAIMVTYHLGQILLVLALLR